MSVTTTCIRMVLAVVRKCDHVSVEARARFGRENVNCPIHFEQLLDTMFGLAAAGKTNRKGLPNPLRLAVIAHAFRDTIRLPWPPAPVQRAALAVLAPIGRALGYTPDPPPHRAPARAAWQPQEAH